MPKQSDIEPSGAARRVATALVLLLCAPACIEDRVIPIDARLPRADGGAARISESYVQGQSQVDVLFVVDNTAGMGGVQSALASGIGALINRLNMARADWRLGLITSDLGIGYYTGPGCMSIGGDGAELQNLPRLPGCTPPKARYITRTNVANPQAAFACIAALGTGGCGFEQPLAATLKALEPAGMPSVNKGFLREAALLMVVFVTNEDDCSAKDTRIYDPDVVALGPWTSYRCFEHGIKCTGQGTGGAMTGCGSAGKYLLPVGDTAQRLRALKPAGSLVLVAAVGPAAPVRLEPGTPEKKLAPSCSSTEVKAAPAIRFKELLAAFGADGVLLSVCGGNLGASLAQAAQRLRTSAGPHCLLHALADPARPACTVTVTSGGGSWSVPPSGPGAPGFRLVHPLIPGCANGAVGFDEGARPPAGALVTITCDFVAAP